MMFVSMVRASKLTLLWWNLPDLLKPVTPQIPRGVLFRVEGCAASHAHPDCFECIKRTTIGAT